MILYTVKGISWKKAKGVFTASVLGLSFEITVKKLIDSDDEEYGEYTLNITGIDSAYTSKSFYRKDAMEDAENLYTT